ncbi:MAG: O-antigen ligase family protein [Actinomycetota bacterium]
MSLVDGPNSVPPTSHDDRERTFISNVRALNIDTAAFLTVWMAALFFIPQQWVLPGGGAIARPSIVLGLIGFGLYLLSRFIPSMVPPGRNSVAIGIWGYTTIVVVSHLLSFNRDLFNHEITAGQREVVMTVSMAAVGLLVGASIHNRERLETVLRRLVAFGAVVAGTALVQFYLAYDIVAEIKFPGMELIGGELSRSRQRSGFQRATGTTAHAIELGIVMAMILPLALHYALHEPVRKRAMRYWVAVFMIGATLPATVSRSAVLAIAISMGTLLSVWSQRQTLQSALLGFVGLICIYVSSPTLLGSILSLFRGLENDTSITARTDDYAVAFEFIGQRPWFGRGAGTWGSDTYLLLDNQMLLSLLEIGWIGVVLLLFLFLRGMFIARAIRYGARDDTTKHLGQVIFGSLAAGLVSNFFVNGLFYQIYVGICFVLIGAAGALYRMMHDQPPDPAVEAVAQQRGLLGVRIRADAKPRWWDVALADSLDDLNPSRRDQENDDE